MSEKSGTLAGTYWDKLSRKTADHEDVTGEFKEKMGVQAADAALSVCPEGFFQHVIRQGESLITIAQRYNISLTELMSYNPNINPYFYTTGQVLCIPAVNVPACPMGTLYAIRDGDTLFSIANLYGTTVEALQAANEWLDPLRMIPGQVMCIPGTRTSQICPETNTSHEFAEGDTIVGLMRAGNFSYGALVESNPDVSLVDVIPGMILCLPPSGSRGECACNTAGRAYRMGEGETLTSLAQRIGADELLVVLVNPMHTPGDFREGQIICVPSAEEAR